MNRERAKELAPIIKAFGDGEKIEGRFIDSANRDWTVKNSKYFFDDDIEWRIEREPREFWINIWSDRTFSSYDNSGTAERHATKDTETIKVREVLE